MHQPRPSPCPLPILPTPLLLLLSSLTLLLSLPPALSECSSCLTFTQVTDDTPWSARSGASLYLSPLSLTYRDPLNSSLIHTAPPFSLIFFGGDPTLSSPALPYNDVWLSSDRGSHWSLIAGNSSTSAAPTPYDRTSFEPNLYSTIAISPSFPNTSDPSSPPLTIAKIGGQYTDGHDALVVWTTLDLLEWNYTRFDDYPAHYVKASAVISTRGVIFVIGGQLADPFNPHLSAEVWRSEDGGVVWHCITTAAPFGPRSAHSTVVLSGPQTPGVDGADVVLVVGGTDGHAFYNDVWASSDECVTWVRLTDAAAFSPRQSFSLLATPEGVLLLIGGQDALSSYNNLYASFDGGYSWHGFRPRNSADAWLARHSHSAALDVNGTLYIAGGLTQKLQYIEDVQRSSTSMSNLTAMQLIFDTSLSPCGVGLFCLDDDTIMRRDGRVYCKRCTEDDAIDHTVFIVIVVAVALAFIAFIVWRNCFVKEATDKPVGFNEHLVNEDEAGE